MSLVATPPPEHTEPPRAVAVSRMPFRAVVTTFAIPTYVGNSTIHIGPAYGFSSSQFPAKLDAEVEYSKRLLSFGDDWDGEGSKGYSFDTWERATGFARYGSEELFSGIGDDTPIPEILPGPEGSIDVRWQFASKAVLLVNVPEDSDKASSFFGRSNSGTFSIKGSLPTTVHASWQEVLRCLIV